MGKKPTQEKLAVNLNGHGLMPNATLAAELAALFRSDEAITPFLRNAIADGLEAGLDSAETVRIRIEAPMGYFKALSQDFGPCIEQVKMGRHMIEQKARGVPFSQTEQGLESAIQDREKYGQRARKRYQKFLAFIASNDGVIEYLNAQFDTNVLDNPEAFRIAVNRFCEVECKLSPPDL